MRKFYFVVCTACVLFLWPMMSLAADKDAIKKNVDGIVSEINKGKTPASFNSNDYNPYAFIMKKNGVLVVHPSLAGQSLKKKAPPVYEALLGSKSTGVWVDYVWKEKQKHSYVKTTVSGLIVGSGYSE
ncbi:MAG: hypothetical protein HUN04_16185 [Desulfobacter sp.]|nr:MAG: hypothetical protein HUN04_16185 [Desulfobacter sp.]